MDLGRFDCGSCPAQRRPGYGCEGGALTQAGQPAIFAGTRYATDTCPRRHLLRNPDLGDVFTLHRAVGDEPVGLAGLDELSGQAVAALALVDAARAEKMKEAPRE